MAKLKKRPDGRYQGKLRIATVDGVPKYKYVFGKSPAEVNEKLAALRVELGRGVDLTQERSLSYWIERWISRTEQTLEPSWQATCEARARVWKANIGYLSVDKITTADLEDVLLALSKENPVTHKPTSKKTLIEYKNIIRRIFAYLRQNRVVTFDPTEFLTITKEAPKKLRDAISDDQIAAIRETQHEVQLPCLIMIYAGLRLGEVCALTWSDVDLQARTISVNKSYNFKSRKVKRPKTAAGTRTVPIPQPLLEALAAAPRTSLLVAPHKGGAYTRCAWEYAAECYGKLLGFSVEAHTLRHTYCTLLFEADVDVLTAKELMGHSDVTTTMKIYTHLRDQKKMQSVEKLDAYLRNEKTDKNTKKQTVL